MGPSDRSRNNLNPGEFNHAPTPRNQGAPEMCADSTMRALASPPGNRLARQPDPDCPEFQGSEQNRSGIESRAARGSVYRLPCRERGGGTAGEGTMSWERLSWILPAGAALLLWRTAMCTCPPPPPPPCDRYLHWVEFETLFTHGRPTTTCRSAGVGGNVCPHCAVHCRPASRQPPRTRYDCAR